ncbi:hypothetical protein N7516_007309 [Penicillium verrucosum]|uniref:uncharacterized protein n=1 Tax=Penicillium verrucosum TaxID=60171 RepID=UPI002545698E|nr:uncharacterized protein N7516_007309 [Penicillium verrucosum]KAJ5932820.1 hypothetical protein N7516_007309 [Penicillium verrucosum]
MSNRPIEDIISCLAVNTEKSLPNADIKGHFLIELVIVTNSWEIRVPTGQGDVRLRHTEEGQRVGVYIAGDKLRHSGKEEMNAVLQASCVLQAIWENPQIGRTWIVQFNLYAALNKDTRKLQTCSCHWDKVSAIARRQFETLKGELNVNCNDPELYRKQEMFHVPGGSDVRHILDDYQHQLQLLEIGGRKRLEAAKHTDYTVE